MIAVALDSAVLPLAVAGRGPAARRRFQSLQTAGARELLLFSDQHDQDHERAAAGSLRRFLPGPADLAELRAIWIVGLPDDEAAALATRARMARVLVNVEDRPALCDFHSVAEVRRGDLLLTVSTGGASPGLAARIRARLAAQYGPEWTERVRLLRACRARWRQDGDDVVALTDALLQANGWLG
ncbi:MAG TPA: NAD(P)-dependent oxidoreductase [Acetobacteraceae bacterium]